MLKKFVYSTLLILMTCIGIVDAQTLSHYEYWFDDDYTSRKAVSNTLGDISFTASTSSLNSGVHFLNFRAVNSAGQYSVPYRYLVYIADNVPENVSLSSYEYWIDDDYSNRVTRSTREQVISFSADISKYGEGVHFLNFRAKNSAGGVGSVRRNLFYLSGTSSSSNPTIVGYRYSFNGVGKYVAVNAGSSYTLNGVNFPMPDVLDVASINSSTPFTFNSSTDEVSLSRTTNVCFAIQFKNSNGQWSTPNNTSYSENDQLCHKAFDLGIQKSVNITKVKAGDYKVVKMVIPEFKTYYIKASQSCQMDLYKSDGTKVVSISPSELINTYASGLDAGTYYGIIYNTITDSNNTATDVAVRLMLTNNYVPAPEITYKDETVTMSCAQEGADIYYTLDGTDPAKTSTKYTAPFKLTHNATIKAIATYSDYADSYVTSYTVGSYKVAAPTIEFANLKVYMSTTTPGAKIYYNIEGNDPTVEGTLYTSPVDVGKNCTVKAVAKLEGYNNSDITSKYIDVDNVTCIAPKFSLSGTQLSITSVTDGATIYYTTDGSVPTTSSNRYTGPITLNHNNTYKAIAVKSGQRNSDVTTYTVDWFQAETPAFSFAGGKLIISCTTPGAVIYYEIGNKIPTTTSVRYTQPIALTDNNVVKAIAVADGFNNSEVATFTPNSFTCDAASFAFDGRSITMHSNTAGAVIHYTTDGRTPTTSSDVYNAPVLLNDLCTVKAVAVKANMNNSNVTVYETPCFYNGGVLKMAKAGSISKAFEWCGTNDIDNVTISGDVDNTDLKFIGDMPVLKDVDISRSTIEGNELKDGVFMNSKFRSINFPGSITKCGKNIFDGNGHLCSIVWNTAMAIPTNALDGINNPNMLLYVDSKSYAPSNVNNVVVNLNAESVTLQDSYDFYAYKGFKSAKISYTHNYSMQTVKGVCRGWESIALPFDVSKITHGKNGVIAPFAKKVADAKPFWLYEMDENKGFVKASDIRANTPYIISMPNNANYADDYILAGNVTFSAENIDIPETSGVSVRYGNFYFTPCFQSISKAETVYPINVCEEYNGYLEGSLFAANLRNVKPFESYLRLGTVSQAKAFIPIFDNSTDGIEDVMLDGSSFRVWSEGHKLYIYSDNKQIVKIYTSSGQLVRSADLYSGVSVINDLYDGIYIINGIKVLVK